MAIYRIKRFSSRERTDYGKMKDFIIGAVEGQAAIEAGKHILKNGAGRTGALHGVVATAATVDALKRAKRLTRKHNPDY